MAAEPLSSPPPRDPQHIVEAERAAYHDELPAPAPDWPPDVRAVYETLLDRLFDWKDVQAQEVVVECGIGSRDIYGRFRHCIGYGIKEFVVHHRLQLAKRLLDHESLSITDVAFAVGYTSPSGFSKTFKRHEGQSPTAFRGQVEG